METPDMSNTRSSLAKEASAPFPWYAVRTFNCQELKVSEFLTENGKEHFIPMTYVERHTRQGQTKRVLAPVIHNMLFVRKDESARRMSRLFAECMVPLNVLRREGSSEFYEIPDCQMTEFRALCDPGFEGTLFLTGEEAEAKPGKEVRIVHGPFSGMTGKLCRVKNNFYFVKILAGVGVMMRISRWYCQVLADGQKT